MHIETNLRALLFFGFGLSVFFGNIFLSPMLIAMDKLTNAERKEIKEILDDVLIWKYNQEIKSQYYNGSSYAMKDLDAILNKYHIEYPKEKTWLWLKELAKNIGYNKEDLQRFYETGECTGCFLAYTDLREIINSLNDRNILINLENAELSKVNLSGTDLSNANFKKANLKKSNLGNTNLTNTNFEETNLRWANLFNANLKGTIIRPTTLIAWADVTNAKFDEECLNYRKRDGIITAINESYIFNYGEVINENYATVYTNDDDLKKFKETGECIYCHLTNLDLRDVITSLNDRNIPINLSYAWLDNSNLSNVNLSNAKLDNARLKNANLSNSNLTNATMRKAYLQNASLKGANLNNANLFGIQTKGPYRSCGTPSDCRIKEKAKAKKKKKSNQLLNNNSVESNNNPTHIDLSEANLTDAHLDYAQLNYADLTNANLTNANLIYAQLKYANLTNANLTHTGLSAVNLKHANLQGAILRSAYFRHAKLKKANLSQANVTDANFDETQEVNLDGTIVDGFIKNKINTILNYCRSKRKV